MGASAEDPGEPGSAVAVDHPLPRAPLVDFGSELPEDFETVRDRVLVEPAGGGPRRLRRLIGLAQPLIGAAQDEVKRRLERLVGDRSMFNTERATVRNSMLNLILYPAVLCALSVWIGGRDVFSKQLDAPILLGLSLASCEWMWRMRESIFHAVTPAAAPLRGSFYAPMGNAVARCFTTTINRRSDSNGVGFDGYYDRAFDDKKERARRYGEVYRFEELSGGYLFQLEFPCCLPPSSLTRGLDLREEMPDYGYQIAVEGAELVVRGRVSDPRVLKLTAVLGAFPPRFTARVPLTRPVAGFRHRYQDKLLEIALPFER